MNEKILIVDLNSGNYTDRLRGHELFNLERNTLDGMYYGYVPPNDHVDIKKFERNAIKSVTGILVVYVQAINKNNKNREIVAFCENATIYGSPQSADNMNREIRDNDGSLKTATYCIESNNLTDLRSLKEKFKIKIADYNSYMFRMQRSMLEKYPELKQKIFEYIKRLRSLDRDDGIEQENIQDTNPASAVESAANGTTQDEYINTPNGIVVKKNPSIAKKVLEDSGHICLLDGGHKTFISSKGYLYMEGHHLIPCTVENSTRFSGMSKLDREENIVCICPNCHRAIHYGDGRTKRLLIEKLLNKQKHRLDSVGLTITLDELLGLYKI